MIKMSRMARDEMRTGWLFILPLLIGVSIFTYGAVIYSFQISLTQWDLLSPANFVGSANYERIFRDSKFQESLFNTLFFVVTLVPSGIVAAMAMAIVLNQKLRALGFFRAAFYLPSITSTVAVGMVWLWIFNPDQGVLNSLLHLLGVADPPRWLESTIWAKPALLILRLWQVSGYYMLMYLAGLQAIPDELYEAAELDGASAWNKVRYITVPLLSNTTFFASTLLIIESFKVFESIYVMTRGGPGNTTATLLYYIYTRGFQSAPAQMGYAAAMAWVLFAILFVVTLVQFGMRRRTEDVGI